MKVKIEQKVTKKAENDAFIGVENITKCIMATATKDTMNSRGNGVADVVADDAIDAVKDNTTDGVRIFLEKVSQDFVQLKFKVGKKFAFRPPRTIFYTLNNNLSSTKVAGENEYKIYRLRLLHEVGHALLEHRDYGLDLERVKMECAAWEKARELCRKYKVEFDEEFMETELDTYRDWLHQRSKCPICGLTRYQTSDGVYHCPGQDIGID